MNAAPSKESGPRMNEAINAARVLVVDLEGEKHGPWTLEEGLDFAAEAGLDLVEVSPNADPVVCKVMDYGKHKYQQQKKKAEARKKQKTVDLKEIKMRPNIDQHDYETKLKAMHRFFESGDKVKVTLRFRGREMAHQERGVDLLKRVQGDFDAIAKVEAMPKLEGRQMMMVLAPR